MYGWKMSGGGGGKPDKKLLAYGKSTVFSDLIREHSTRALNAEYHMEERTDLYDCGKTDFFVIPTGYHGFDETPNFASHFTLPWKDIFEDGQYVDGNRSGASYLVGYFVKISKNNTTTPENKGYDIMFPGSSLSQSLAGQNQCADILNNLWLARVPGYGLGGQMTYKHGHMYRSSGTSTGESDDETIKGMVYPDISPKVYSRVRQHMFYSHIWYLFINSVKIESYGNTQYYRSYVSNTDLWDLQITYYNTMPNADIFVRGVNKWILNTANHPVLVAQDENYRYYAFGFEVLGAW